MKIYLFKNFNNYYNREITRFNTINEYIENDILKNNYAVRSTGESIDSTENGKRVNFAEHDGIRTELTYNYDPNQDWVPSYVIVGDIESRWFVIDYYKNRKGQYKLYLKRDTISDFKRLLVNSKAYIERASYLDNPYPLIYNKDSDSFNEIKQNEYLLTDDTKLNWYVIYLANNTQDTTITINSDEDAYYIKASFTSFDDVPYYTDIVTNKKNISIENLFYERVDLIKIGEYSYYYNSNSKVFSSSTTIKKGVEILNSLNKMTDTDKSNLETILNTSNTFNGEVPDTISVNNYKQYNNRNIKIGDDIYSQKNSYNINKGDFVTYSSNSNLTTLIKKYYNGYGSDNIKTQRTFFFMTIELTKLYIRQYTITIPSSLKSISKLPYKALVLPCTNRFVASNIKYYQINAGKLYQYNYELNNILVNKIVEKLANKVYDVQLFPYCPLEHMIIDYTIVFTGVKNKNIDYVPLLYDGNDYSALLALPDANFSFNIANTFIEDKGLMTNKELKIEHQCESYRLCSPDNSSIYNLDILANGGIDYFNVDCTLKPYASYIHINPNFKYLNGIDTDDYRGLVIKSDFAIPMVSNNWETYVQNNVNYQKIFDRQIQNMDVNNNITNQQAKWSIVTGALQGASTGGFIGNSIGGFGGALIGGVAGGVASGVAGYYDLQYQKQLQQENKSYATDTYNLNLGNIKAQANTLTKVDNFDYNNKIFPYIEFYSCTDQEKEYYRNKIEVSGFNIDVITDDISKWYNDNDGLYANKYTDLQMNYLKCRLIKIDYNMTTDVLTNNILNDLAEELNKGVYI